jgi:hypothetical protein
MLRHKGLLARLLLCVLALTWFFSLYGLVDDDDDDDDGDEDDDAKNAIKIVLCCVSQEGIFNFSRCQR